MLQSHTSTIISLFPLFDKLLQIIYPALMGSKTPPQNSAEAKKLGGGRAAHKSPIGEG